MKFPRTSRGGFFPCQSLTPAVQTLFAECILACATPFVLHSLLWLHPSLRPFIPSSLVSSFLWLPRPHAQTTEVPTEPNPRAQSKLNIKENRKKAQPLSGLLSDSCRSMAHGHAHSMIRPAPHPPPIPCLYLLFFSLAHFC